MRTTGDVSPAANGTIKILVFSCGRAEAIAAAAGADSGREARSAPGAKPPETLEMFLSDLRLRGAPLAAARGIKVVLLCLQEVKMSSCPADLSADDI